MRTLTSFIAALVIMIVIFAGCRHDVHILPNDEIYTCKTHIHVIDDHPAKCSLDGSELIKKKITEEQRQMLKDKKFDRAKE